MAGNMESMLLGSDSSSSDGSDNEDEVVDAGTVPTSAAAAAVAVTAVARPPAPAPAAAPADAPAAARSVPAAATPVPAPAPILETAARPSSSLPAPAAAAPPTSPAAAATGPTPGMSQSDISARLKSLYSPASKAAPPSAGHPAAAPLPPPAAAPAPRAAAPAPLPARPPVAPTPMPSHPHPGSATYQQRAAAAAVAAGLAPRPAATAGAPTSAGAPAPTTTSAMPGAAAVAAHRQRAAAAAAAVGSGVRAPGIPAPAAAPGASAPAPAGSGGGDPFEPTPLKAMMHRQARVAAGLPPEPVAPPVPPGGAAPVAGARRGPVVVPGGLGPGSAQTTPVSSMTSAVGSTTASAAAPARSSSISSVPSVPPVPPTSVPSAVGSSVGSMSSSGSSVKPMDRATLEREAKQRKEKFLMFTRVLMKYLEQKDPQMHARAKAVIKECAEKNKKKEAGYHSLTASMQTRLRATVGDVYWRKAEDYLNHFLKQKLQQARQEAAARGKPAPLPAAPGAQPAPVPSPLRPATASSVPATVPSTVASPASSPAQMALAKQAGIAPAPGAVLPAHGASQNVIDQQERDRAAARKKIAEIERQAAEAQKAREQNKAALAFRKEQLKAERKKKQMEAKAIAAQNKAKEKTERDRARAAERSAAKANNAKLLQMQHESAKLAALQGKAAGVGVPSPLPPVATPAPAVASPSSVTASGLVKSPDATSITSSASTKKKKPVEKKKASATKASAAASAATKAAAEAKAEPPPREYAELMEMVDHAVSYDWSSATTILGREHKGDVNIDEEQRHLLYGDDGRTGVAGGMQRQLGVGSGTVEGSTASTSYPGSPPGGLGIRTHSINAPAPPQQPATAESTLPPALRGWNRRNVISARTAWAKVRLPEQEKERAQAVKNGVSFVPQGVGGFTLPGFHRGAANAATRKTSLVGTTTTGWFNDQKAEEDSTLALLSEATDVYLKSILEGAVKAARQRQNLDGIRLWHRQHGPSKPPLSLRLGCDVRRQVALREGNDAKTCQRMEEALARQNADKKRSRVDDELMLFNATSMSDLSRRPKLKGAAAKADYDGKRKFEVYGGKGSGAPPLGRVPKEAKITPRDFRLCMEDPLFPHKRKGTVMSPAFM